MLHRQEFLEWHDDFNRWIPSLAGVRFDPDGMSAFIRRLLERHGQGSDQVSTLGGTDHKPAVVYEFDGSDVLEAGFLATPSPNDRTPIGYAHASIIKPDLPRSAERAARTTLASRMILEYGTIDMPKPAGA